MVICLSFGTEEMLKNTTDLILLCDLFQIKFTSQKKQKEKKETILLNVVDLVFSFTIFDRN